MSRQLKFRAWDKLEKRFIYPDKGYQGHFALDLNGRFYNLQNGSGGDDYIVQQSTGLKDKNEKEIYEGDIVQKMIIGPVEYFLGEFSIGGVTPLKDFLIIPSDENQPLNFNLDLEIIGNIFENPELLK